MILGSLKAGKPATTKPELRLQEELGILFLKPIKSNNKVRMLAVDISNSVECLRTELCNILTKKTVHKVSFIITSKKKTQPSAKITSNC